MQVSFAAKRRGIVAIGVIAAIFTADQLYGKILIWDVSLETLTSYLLFFWLLYILFMAVGVSEDLFGFRTSGFCQKMGHLCFISGICGFAVLLLVAPIFYFRDHGMILQEDLGVLIMVLILVYLIVRGFSGMLADTRTCAIWVNEPHLQQKCAWVRF